MMKTIREKTEYLMRNKPEEVISLMETWADKMPEQADTALSLAIYGRHILSKDTYNTIMECLGINPHYGSEVLEEPAFKEINFSKEDFTELDLLYEINRLHMMFHEIIDGLEKYVLMARDVLTDKYYPSNPSERAYNEAIEILRKHNKV